MIQININEAKSRLSKYAKMVKAGETVILCDRNKPFAEIRPLDLVKDSGNIATYARDFFPPDFRDWRIYLREWLPCLHIALL